MQKKLHNLQINKSLEHAMPPLQEMELGLLTQSLIKEGCRDPLVVWKETGELVDGHNRYRVCRENSIPFTYIEMSFTSELDGHNIQKLVSCFLSFDYVKICHQIFAIVTF